MRINLPSLIYAVTILSFASLVYFTFVTYPYALSDKATLLMHHLLLKSREGIITFNPADVAKSFILLIIFPLFPVFGLIYIINRDTKYALLSFFFLIAHIAAESKTSFLVSREAILPYLPIIASAVVYLEGASKLGREQERYDREKETTEAVEKMEADPLLKPHLSHFQKIEYLRAYKTYFGDRTTGPLKTFFVPASKLLVFLFAVLLVLFSQKFFIWRQSSTVEFLLFRHTLEAEFNYLVFNVLSLLFLLFVFLSFKEVATILYNATRVGAYEKSALVENTIGEFLRSTKKIESIAPDFKFSNFERNLFFAFMLIMLLPAALSGNSDTIKKATVQMISEQPGYEEFTYLESLNENLADSSNLFDRINYLLAFDGGKHVVNVDQK